MSILIIGRGNLGCGLAEVLRARQRTHALISHTDDYEKYLSEATLVVNAAGIVGRKACQEEAAYTEVMDANVHLPYELAESAKTWGVPCVLISSGGVYAKPAQVIKRETDDLNAPNLYIMSKINMELVCRNTDAIIFRVSNFVGDGSQPNDYVNRIKSWDYVADTYVSTLRIETFADILLKLDRRFCGEIFNAAEPKLTYLPSLAPDKRVIDPSEQSETATVSHILGVQKLWRQMSLRKT